MKESMLQEIEDLQDKAKQLDEDMEHQDKEIEKLETFINSENGMNQQKVADLENELSTDEETITYLEGVIEELKKKTTENEAQLIQYDIEYVKKSKDLHDQNIKLVETEQDLQLFEKSLNN